MNPVGTESNPSIHNTKTLQPAITTALNTIENIVWLVGCCEYFVTNLHRHHSAIDDNGDGNSGIGGGRGGGRKKSETIDTWFERRDPQKCYILESINKY
ncbi:hypothetical protein DERP_002661 [Dermatophagoides pteronyssinus]|uniref:Uncharacterized protein n=1 Tax=Dermatophagoides pteronyssinus TaxID=6956 RepID=A0ABQ8JVI8_DERPT|nr:hypothetical protein DERP_002661 [Dermatophagoides pteronyssinus]